MPHLSKTDSGIYYLHDYYPKRYHNITKAQERLRQNIWDFKDLDEDSIELFADELMEAISVICRQIRSSKIGLVAVPPSKVDKESPIRECIQIIRNWYELDISEDEYDCDKDIYDYGNLLTRTEDIKTSHRGYGRRPSYDDQKASIACSRNRLWRYHTDFILLDDVTTMGTSMKACKDILVEHGSDEKRIYQLVIAKTV